MQGSIDIRVRYCECDPMGVVHHTVYPVWFEMGRTELLRSTGRTYRNMEQAGLLLAVVKLEVTYKQPARYDDLVQLRTTLARVGAVKVEHSYELWRGEDLLVSGATVLACIDRSGRAKPMPEGLLTDPPAPAPGQATDPRAS
jgi:acyl-CoA thioester hydrolase